MDSQLFYSYHLQGSCNGNPNCPFDCIKASEPVKVPVSVRKSQKTFYF